MGKRGIYCKKPFYIREDTPVNRPGLTNNQLKILTMITMTIDHIGLILFPYNIVLRMIGRLAFPIYAFMIAEGCRHTRSLPRHLGSIAVLAAGYQVVYWVSQGSLYQCILVTFSLSIGLIWLAQTAREQKSPLLWLLTGVSVLAVFLFTEALPLYLPESWDFAVDYGFVGVMIPVAVYFAPKPAWRLVFCGIGLALLSLDTLWIQWLSLLALPLLALYNGQRGKANLKRLFYFYYPAHLLALYALAYIL